MHLQCHATAMFLTDHQSKNMAPLFWLILKGCEKDRNNVQGEKLKHLQ